MAQVYQVTISITSPVGSDLPDFPIYVDLSDMPAGFWSTVKSDGGDIRVVTNDLIQLPLDLAFFRYNDQTGALFFKHTIRTGDNEWYIQWGDAALERRAHTDTYGRNEVWSDYECVYLFGESNEDHTGNSESIHAAGDVNNFSASTLKTFTQDPHNGLTYDPVNSHWFVIDTNAIYKFNEDFSSLLATNADPVGDVNTATGEALTHCGDACLFGDYIIIPVNDYPGNTTDYLVRFNKSDLSYHSCVDVSGSRTNLSGICYNSGDGYLYSTYWSSMIALDYWDPSDFSHLGTLVLSNVTPFSQAQGIEYWHNAFWITSDNSDEVYRCELDGHVQNTGLFGEEVSSGNLEGISAYDDTLVILIDPSAGNSYAEQWTPMELTYCAGGGAEMEGAQYKEQDGIDNFTVWTMAATYKIDSVDQMTIITYRDEDGGGADRASLVIDNGNSVGVWDNTNGWLYASPTIDPGTTNYHRIATSYNGSTARKLYHDGALVNTESSITARDSEFDMITVGANGAASDYLDGRIGFSYLRGEVLTDDWLEAEWENVSDPDNFYTIGSVTDAETGSEGETPEFAPANLLWTWPVSEKLIFNTEILASHNRTYQRIAKRQGLPLRIVSGKIALKSPLAYAEFEALIHTWLKNKWHVDLWPLATILSGSLSAGASTLSFDTRYAGYIAGQYALIWESSTQNEYVLIDSVSNSQLVLDGVTVNSYSGSKFIMPVKTGWCISAAKPKWVHGGAVVDISFAIEDFDDVTGFSADMTYDSYTVLTNPSKSKKSSADFSHDPDVFVQDSGTRPFNIISNSSFNIVIQPHGWVCESLQTAWELRQFLYDIKGRQQAFLVPTFKDDLTLSRPVGSGDTNIYINNIGVHDNIGVNDMRKYLAFRPAGSDPIVRKITVTAEIDASEEKLTINASPGQAFDAGDKLCWVDRCVLAEDEIEFNWLMRGKCLIETLLERVES